MVIAVIAVRMMQVAIDQIVGVIAMRDRLVPAAGSVLMTVGMAGMHGMTLLRILRRDADDVPLAAAGGRVIQTAVLNVVDVALVPDRRVTAAGTVTMWLT